MSNVSVVFNADTGQFVANIEGATKTVARSAEAVATAKNTILDSFKMQMKAAKDVGASAEEMEAIQRRCAQQIASVSETNAQRVITSLNKISERQKQVAAELANLNSVVPLPSGHAAQISDRMAASAAVRAASGNVGVRPAENFLASIPGVGEALAGAFPLIGAAALTAEIMHGVEALHAMYEAAQHIPAALRDGFEGINGPLMVNVDGLRKTNDELEISIAHLEHKPANTLALAIDEARLNADRLAESAGKAATEVRKVLEENKVGLLQFAMSGQIGTGPVSDEVQRRMNELRDLQRANRDALRSGSDSPEAQQARESQIETKTRDLYSWAHQTRTDVQSFNQNGQLDANVNILEGVEDYASDNLDEVAQQKRNTVDQQKQKQLQDAEKQRQQAAENQRRAAEAYRKAMEAQRKQWEHEDDQATNAGRGDPHVMAAMWDLRLMGLRKGSEQYLYAYHLFTEENKKAGEEDARAVKETAAKAQQAQREAFALGERLMDEWIRQDEEKAKALSKAQQEQIKQRFALDLASVSIQAQTGHIGNHDAAMQEASIHAAEYREQMAQLTADLNRERANDPSSVASINAQAALDKAAAERRIQIMQDTAKVAASTWDGALRNANALWVQDAEDSSKQVVALYRQAIDGFNDDLSNFMVNPERKNGMSAFQNFRNSLASTGQGMGKTLADDGLKRMEAPVLNAFGMGKRDGSSANAALFVTFADAATHTGMGSLGGGLAAIGQMFHKNTDAKLGDLKGGLAGLGKSLFPSGGDDGADDSGADGAGSLGGKIGGFFAKLFGGGKAVGGSVNSGTTYLVGEAGPELFSPHTSGTIIPNHALGGSQTVNYSVNVANGVTPEQMKMHVQQALRQYHPQAVAASVSAMRNIQRSVPPGRR